MKGLVPQKKPVSVLVIGSDTTRQMLINQCIQPEDSTLPLPTEKIKEKIHGDYTLDFHFEESNNLEKLESPHDIVIITFDMEDENAIDQTESLIKHWKKNKDQLILLVNTENNNLSTNTHPIYAKAIENLSSMMSSKFGKQFIGYFTSIQESATSLNCMISLMADNYLKAALKPSKQVENEINTIQDHSVNRNHTFESMNIVVLGDQGSGKSSLIGQFLGLGDIKTYPNVLQATSKIINIDGAQAHVRIQDSDEHTLLKPKNFDLAILCFDLTKSESFKSLFDVIYLLTKKNKDILFMLVGNHYDNWYVNTATRVQPDIIPTFSDLFNKMHPANFIGCILNSNTDPRFNRTEMIFNTACQTIHSNRTEEKQLLEIYRAEQEKRLSHNPFAHTNVPKDNDDLFYHIRSASRTDIETRSRGIFVNLGWFDKNGNLTKGTPDRIRQKRLSLDVQGISLSGRLKPNM